MKRCIVTGATGFVGYHLTEHFLKSGYQVHVIVRQNSPVRRLQLLQALQQPPVIHIHDGTTASMLNIMKKASPDTIFHLASMVLVENQLEDIEPLITSNILFGTQVIESAVRTGVRYFINTGTFWQNYNNEPYNPACLYAATKQAFEDILLFYVEAYSLKAVTLKLFDTYGPYDHRNKLFNLLIKACISGQILAMSPGEQLLDMVFIDDVVAAYIRADYLLENEPADIAGACYAVSSGAPISLKNVVSIYERIVDRKVPIQWGGRPYRTREVMIPCQGKILPGWSPIVNIEEGIRRTVVRYAVHGKEKGTTLH